MRCQTHDHHYQDMVERSGGKRICPAKDSASSLTTRRQELWVVES